MYNTQNKPKRTNTTLRPKYTPKSNLLKNSIFYKFTEIYTNLPKHLIIKEIKHFKTQIKTHISNTFDPYSFPVSQADTDTDTDI